MSRSGAPHLLLLAAAVGSSLLLIIRPQDSAWTMILLSVLAFFAGRTPAWPIGAVVIAFLLGGVAASQVRSYDASSIVPEVMLPVTLYVAGLALRAHERLVRSVAAQTDELAAERDAYVHLSIRHERARIAAELHDVVAHAISMMVVQASAGQRLAAHEPARTGETFDIIIAAARQAQADVARLADLLAEDSPPAEGGNLAIVREIIDTARASGLPVSLQISGDTVLPEATAHTALRVVQEALTNALRYAPGADVRVKIEGRPGALELSIDNNQPTAPARTDLGTGHGLTGLRERVNACGGTLYAGPTDNGGWQVRARLAC